MLTFWYLSFLTNLSGVYASLSLANSSPPLLESRLSRQVFNFFTDIILDSQSFLIVRAHVILAGEKIKCLICCSVFRFAICTNLFFIQYVACSYLTFLYIHLAITNLFSDSSCRVLTWRKGEASCWSLISSRKWLTSQSLYWWEPTWQEK